MPDVPGEAKAIGRPRPREGRRPRGPVGGDTERGASAASGKQVQGDAQARGASRPGWAELAGRSRGLPPPEADSDGGGGLSTDQRGQGRRRGALPRGAPRSPPPWRARPARRPSPARLPPPRGRAEFSGARARAARPQAAGRGHTPDSFRPTCCPSASEGAAREAARGRGPESVGDPPRSSSRAAQWESGPCVPGPLDGCGGLRSLGGSCTPTRRPPGPWALGVFLQDLGLWPLPRGPTSHSLLSSPHPDSPATGEPWCCPSDSRPRACTPEPRSGSRAPRGLAALLREPVVLTADTRVSPGLR